MRASLVLVIGLAAGCSGGSSDAVWSSSVTKLELRSAGGLPGPEPTTPECPGESIEYTLVVAGRVLSAVRCSPAPTAPYTLMRTAASRVLSAAEFDGLVSKLEALHVVSLDTCGADKPEVIVTVTTASGATEYGDSFYSCDPSDHRPKIETSALDMAEAALGRLAFPSP